MSIDRDVSRRVAHLARIAVPETELDSLSGELNKILALMDMLGEADIENVSAMTSVTPMELRRRRDEVTDGNYSAKIVSNAPETREGFFVVPKVVE